MKVVGVTSVQREPHSADSSRARSESAPQPADSLSHPNLAKSNGQLEIASLAVESDWMVRQFWRHSTANFQGDILSCEPNVHVFLTGALFMSDSNSLESARASIAKLQQAYTSIRQQMSQVIVGQSEVIDQLLISLFSRGHCLLEGVPGLAKTLMISTLARTLSMSFSRIQFTPDLMPADITGTDVLQTNQSTGEREFRFINGPLFHNLVLADEINRTPPKTQAALLEAMQERQVTVGQMRHVLNDPFFVLATQNPIEQEGTYQLPEAQQDRFMFKVFVTYPSFAEEKLIAIQTTGSRPKDVSPVLTAEEVIELQSLVREVPVSEHVVNYALALVRQTRLNQPETPAFITEWLSWGAGPRAVQFMLIGAKARALLQGRTHVTTEDVAALAAPVLRHRIVVNFAAESEGTTPDIVIKRLIAETPSKESDLSQDPRFKKMFAA